jgi:hypothetical protein
VDGPDVELLGLQQLIERVEGLVGIVAFVLAPADALRRWARGCRFE